MSCSEMKVNLAWKLLLWIIGSDDGKGKEQNKSTQRADYELTCTALVYYLASPCAYS